MLDPGVYAFELLEEALSSRFHSNFLKWCLNAGKSFPSEVSELLEGLNIDFAENNPERARTVIDQLTEQYVTDMQELIEEFRQDGMALSPTFCFWDQLLAEIIVPFKVFMMATRSSQWATRSSQ